MLSKILINVTVLILWLMNIIQYNYYQFNNLIIINSLKYYYGWRLQVIQDLKRHIQVVGTQTIGWPYAVPTWNQKINIYVDKENIIIIIIITTINYFVIFHPING